MEIQTIKKGADFPKIVEYYKNNAAFAIVDGDCVVFDLAAAAADLGNAVVGSTAATQKHVGGIARGVSTPIGSYAPIQIYGVHNNVKYDTTSPATAIAVGDAAKTSAVARCAGLGATADDPVAQMGFWLQAQLVSTNGRGKIFIRNM